jgi:hypothetical protein
LGEGRRERQNGIWEVWELSGDLGIWGDESQGMADDIVGMETLDGGRVRWLRMPHMLIARVRKSQANAWVKMSGLFRKRCRLAGFSKKYDRESVSAEFLIEREPTTGTAVPRKVIAINHAWCAWLSGLHPERNHASQSERASERPTACYARDYSSYAFE